MDMGAKTTEEFEQAYRQLNTGQRQAVDTIDGPVMVLAGPGTGKTQTLTVRIGAILQQTQLDPWNILCLTFTEAAAAEMRTRLAHLIGSPAYSVRMSTFHSFCNDVIQEHPEIFALAPGWQPLSQVERLEIIQEMLDSLPGTSPLKPFGNPYLYLKDCVQHIQALKQEDITPAGFRDALHRIELFAHAVSENLERFSAAKTTDRTNAACEEIYKKLLVAAREYELADSLQEKLRQIYEVYTSLREDARAAGKARTKFKNDIKRFVDRLANHLPRQQELAKVYERYQKELRKRGRYDFEDMIIMVVAAFKKDSNILASYQEQFQYILVDEFQDTNGAQNEVVDLLGSLDAQPNIFVVGDDKQSIYRFQGASVANMLSFYERYKEHIRVVSLSENYRNSVPILEAASAVVVNNKQSLTRSIPGIHDALVSKAKRKQTLLTEFVVEFPDQEVAKLAERIGDLLKRGEDPNEIAVLVRYNRDAEALAPALRQADIPVVLAAGENALEQPVVQQWLTAWRYIADGVRTDHLLADIIQFDWWGINSLDALRAIHAAGVSRRSLTLAFASASPAIVAMMDRLASWRSLAARTTVPTSITTMLEESGFLDRVLQESQSVPDLEHMNTILQQAKQASISRKNLTLASFVELLDLHVRHGVALTTPPRRLMQSAVTIMTAHKSKGQEFAHVFLPQFVDGHWGGSRAPHVLPLPHGLVRYDLIVEGENDEDERRLLYVALTRAKQTITLSRARMNDNNRPAVPSRFERELPAEQIETVEFNEAPSEATRRLQQVLAAPVYPASPLRAWLEELLTDYVLSVTHLNNYLEDPKLFYERNLLQIPSVRTTYQAMGTAVHNALKDLVAAFTQPGKLPPQDFLLERFASHLQRETLTDQEYADVLAVGRKQLAGYYDHYQSEFSVHSLGEYDFRNHRVRLEGIPITGKIDKIELLEGKTVNVVDYKTGSPERGLLQLKPNGNYHRQIVFYKLLCENSEQFPYNMISGEIDFIRPDKRGQFIKKKLEVTDKDLEVLTADIKRVWQEIHELKFLSPMV